MQEKLRSFFFMLEKFTKLISLLYGFSLMLQTVKIIAKLFF